MRRSVFFRRFLAASVFVLAGADVALAQAEGSANPAIPNAAITSPPSAPREWSGEDGSSGHPEMKASAIRAAAANFENCLEHLWPLAAKRNISRASFDRHVKGLTPDLRIMDLMDAQPEFTKAFWDYLDILVNDKRIATGQEMLAKHKAAFDKVEREYGVDRYIITAIWGVESNYGTLGGDRPVIRSTATLACVGRRQAYFRDEFLATLEILHRNDVRPEQLKGSWAGAFGPTQFMPTAFKRYAVDADGEPVDEVAAAGTCEDRVERRQPQIDRAVPEGLRHATQQALVADSGVGVAAGGHARAHREGGLTW